MTPAQSGQPPARPVVVAIPIYKPAFSPMEQFSIDYSLACAANRECVFFAPAGMDCRYYRERYPQARFEFFAADFFTSVDSYSRLLLDPDFCRRFGDFEFVLVLQPDAILFRDDLDFWTAQDFDYVGAPWPDGLELTLWRDRFRSEGPRRVKAWVGNGGLSLRRVSKCLKLLDEFPETRAAFVAATANEDSFFSILGLVSADFRIPDQSLASKFAMELQPQHYFAMNGGHYPMGAHAWWIVEPHFWAPCLPPLATVLGQPGTGSESP